MSVKHFFSSGEGLVALALQGAIASNPSLSIIVDSKVVFNPLALKKNVAVVAGGGAGHEPGASSTVGRGGLAAVVSGDVFASPSAKQVITAVDAVGSTAGTVLVVMNYTGDCLHFGLAAQMVNARGAAPARTVIVSDDVSIGRTKLGLVGRRGLAGFIVTIKILGAASESGLNFTKMLQLGDAVAGNLVSIGAGLDHCHRPGGSDEFGALANDTVEIGMGIHNEAGFIKVSPQPAPEELITTLLKYLLDPNDTERAFVPFAKGDTVALVINNLGGLSALEISALAHLTLKLLDSQWKIVPVRVYQGSFLSSLNGQSFSITLLNMTGAAKAAATTLATITNYLDADTDILTWPRVPTQTRPRAEQLVIANSTEDKFIVKNGEDVIVDPVILEKTVRQACNNILAAEPNLTKFDTISGDGDCGANLEAGAKGLLAALDSGIAKNGSILAVVNAFVHITESSMGGTLGAIIGLYMAAFLSALRTNRALLTSSGAPILLSTAAAEALVALRQSTPAGLGDRTCMDCLIPFVTIYSSSKGDIVLAAAEAWRAMLATEALKPKLGRAAYASEGKALPVDPGAYGIAQIVNGLSGKGFVE